MLTDTQISSILIPHTVWEAGLAGRPDLPPLRVPARDALDIERRAEKRVNLRNEIRRYTLCCDRMQGIALELSRSGIATVRMQWYATSAADEGRPNARAFLAVIEELARTIDHIKRVATGPTPNLYNRVARVYFPPDHARIHRAMFQAMRQGAGLDKLFERAAKTASLSNSQISGEQCAQALEARYTLLQQAEAGSYGLVDVVEIV
jgi:hypothetical protein